MRKNRFVSPGKKEELLYIVAVSGGPDSTFLLYKMHSLGYRVIAAHVNYGKRYDSLHDEELVVEHCKKLSIRLFIERPSAYKKGNFQAIARELRYKFFLQIAEGLSSEGFRIGGVVVAHNFEDLLETYQLQKERKSLVSYWGLPVQSQFGEWSVFRPVVNFGREQIIKFLVQKEIKYSLDYTNDTKIYRRNVVRRGIFMLSERKKSLLSKQIEKENLLLLQDIEKVSRKIKVLFNKNILDIGNEEWLSSETEIKQRVIYALLNSFSKSKFLSHKKKTVVEICRQLQSRKKRIVIKVGNGLAVVKLNEVVTFEKEESQGRF